MRTNRASPVLTSPSASASASSSPQVGYGDVTPNSTFGQMLSIFAMFFGVIFLSMPLAIVGENFTATWADREKVIFVEKLREIYHKKHIGTVEDMLEEFDLIEKEYEGELSFPEFRDHVVNVLKMEVESTQLKRVFRSIDEDGSGTVSFYEFVTLFFEGKESSVTEKVEQEGATRARRTTVAGTGIVLPPGAHSPPAAHALHDESSDEESVVSVGSCPGMDPRSLEAGGGGYGGGGLKQSRFSANGASFKNIVSDKTTAFKLQKKMSTGSMTSDSMTLDDEPPRTRAQGRRGSMMGLQQQLAQQKIATTEAITKEQVDVIMESQQLILEQLAAINAHLGISGAETSPLARRVTYKRETSEFFDKDEDE